MRMMMERVERHKRPIYYYKIITDNKIVVCKILILIYYVTLEAAFFVLIENEYKKLSYNNKRHKAENIHYIAQISFFSCTFPLSTTYTLTEESTATSCGSLN